MPKLVATGLTPEEFEDYVGKEAKKVGDVDEYTPGDFVEPKFGVKWVDQKVT